MSSGTITWNHFFVTLPATCIAAKAYIGPKLANSRATHDVLRRGLEELTLDSVDTVLELVAQNSLYRGEESRHALEGFRGLLTRYAALPRNMGQEQDVFIWQSASTTSPAISRIRNTAIGTLLIDLSHSWYDAAKPCNDELCMQRDTRHSHEPLELEDAVRKFETSIMAPANYKRPTALVSKAMIEKARAKIDELGLASALERRYAVLEDITVNNILFVDRSSFKIVTCQRGGGKTAEAAFADMAAKVPTSAKTYAKVEEIGIEKFLSDVLPTAKGLEVLLENRHAGNLVSLIAPVDPTAKPLFKWPNAFSWSYAGDAADSIKERVKRAGGAVTGDLCCRLAWDYADDLDFHMKEPGYRAAGYDGLYSGGTSHIYYGNVRRLSASGGMLDLDANGCAGMKAEPAENIFYADRMKMAEGLYELSVHNYARRSAGTGFEAEVEFGGTTHTFAYDKVLRTGETVIVATILYTRKDGFHIVSSLPLSIASKTVWGLQTQTFQKAAVVMLSPNFWVCPVCAGSGNGVFNPKVGAHEDCPSCMGNGQNHGVGNKHWFFMLEGCANEGTARPFYNEMLRSDLEPHRKTMEMVGAKMKTDLADRQLSGLGFSSTQRAELTVRVTGSIVRVLKVVF